MSLIAGIFSRKPGNPLTGSIRKAIRQNLSRDPSDEVRVFEDERFFLAKVDVGAFGEPALHVAADGSASALTGEPLLVTGADGRRSRTEDLTRLHAAWSRGEWSVLEGVQGVFSAVHYDPVQPRISLVTDKIGVRSLYHLVSEEWVIFASALRIFESIREVPKRMDVCAMVEMATVGAPLGGRTPYEGISLLGPAELIHVTDAEVARTRYWKWDRVTRSSEPEETLRKEAYRRFLIAVERRIGSDTQAIAALSGGLDSRCVVTALRNKGVGVHTFNTAARGTQDQAFGAEYARQVGAVHHEWEVERGSTSLGWTVAVAKALGAERLQDKGVEHPRLVWVGDAGSVSLGHVGLSPRMLELLRSGDQEGAISDYLKQKGTLPRKLLRPEVARALEGVPEGGIREQLDAMDFDDPGRGFHVFMMTNGRRSLRHFFEDVDLHRLEVLMPFYDSDFVEATLSVPVELSLRHGFYNRWIGEFPPVFMSTPWQAYPGHAPCPLPIPEGLIYQWERNVPFKTAHARARRQRLLHRATGLLRAGSFPDALLDKRRFWFAALLYRLGVRDYGYMVRFIETLSAYWNRSDGMYVLPGHTHVSSSSRPRVRGKGG